MLHLNGAVLPVSCKWYAYSKPYGNARIRVGSLLGELALGTHIILLIILETSSSAYRSGVLAPKGKVRYEEEVQYDCILRLS